MAGKMLDKVTHDRVRDESPVRECVKRTVFELIGKLHDIEQTASADAAGVSSKSNDGVSVVYTDYGKAQQNRQSELMSIIKLYLNGERDANGVPLLFGGVCHDTLRQ